MTSSAKDSVALTGCGWVTPFAAGFIDDVLGAAPDGQAAASAPGAYRAVPDELLGEYPDLAKELKSDKSAWITAVALEHARRQAGLQPDSLESERLGMVLGYGLAGQLGMINFANEVRQQSPRFVSPIHFPQTVGNYLAGALARGYNIKGPNFTLASGPASGLDAITEGCDLIAGGKADVVFAGGADTWSSELAEGLATPNATLSEGACLFVLESSERADARGAAPLANIMRGSSDSATAGEIPRAGQAILSSASSPHPGAIFIAHWTGLCPGACGPAALAAVIGAARGHDVPLVDVSDPATVSAGRISLEELPLTNATVPAVVFAEAEAAERRTLRISIPTR